MTVDTLIAVGDSVVWGQALAYNDKFVSHVYERLTGETLREKNIKARSGAIIGEGDNPAEISADISRIALHEVPHSAPTILEQVEQFPEGDDPTPASVDMVILDGGVNDTGFTTFLHPDTSKEELEATTLKHNYREMTTLLKRTRDTFPNALIVVTGYYPVISDETDFEVAEAQISETAEDEGVPGIAIGVAAALFELYDFFTDTTDDIVSNSLFFHRHQLYQLRRAVTEVAADPEWQGPGILFAHPGFGPENSLFADDSWVFDLEGHGDPSVFQERIEGCQATDAGIACKYAMAGHPNWIGADQYAEAVYDSYSRHGTMSIHGPVSKLAATNGDSVSVREALERYSLRPETGLRTSLLHTTVDCISVMFETGNEGLAAGGTDVYLHLAGERWAIPNEYVGENSRDTFVIDPVLDWGRQLHLWEIDGVAFEFDGDWWDAWDLNRLELQINGLPVYERSFSEELDDEFTEPLAYPA